MERYPPRGRLQLLGIVHSSQLWDGCRAHSESADRETYYNPDVNKFIQRIGGNLTFDRVYYFRFNAYPQSTEGSSITPRPKNSLMVENLSWLRASASKNMSCLSALSSCAFRIARIVSLSFLQTVQAPSTCPFSPTSIFKHP